MPRGRGLRSMVETSEEGQKSSGTTTRSGLTLSLCIRPNKGDPGSTENSEYTEAVAFHSLCGSILAADLCTHSDRIEHREGCTLGHSALSVATSI
jgi:hypothetical protein